MDPTPQSLSMLPFFQNFPQEALRMLSASAMQVRLEPGVQIFRKGETADRFYVLQSGSIAVGEYRADGRRERLQVLGAGDVVGWSWLLPPHVWQFDAWTLEPVEALCFSGTRLRVACDEDPTLGYPLVKAMASALALRLQAARDQLLSRAPGK